MKKFTLLLAAAVLVSAVAAAGEYKDSTYVLKVSGIYGNNTAWNHYGGVELSAYLPFTKYFEMDAAISQAGANTFCTAITPRVKFKMKTGEIFLDGTVHFRDLLGSRTAEFVTAASFGYRMDYFEGQAGIFSRTIMNLDRKADGNEDFVCEPFNLLLRLAFRVRPATCRWNLGGGITNFTGYEFERIWQPMFFIDGHCDIIPHLRISAEVMYKPTGMFHLTAAPYGFRTGVGLSYVF